jgi:hypothetical protein
MTSASVRRRIDRRAFLTASAALGAGAALGISAAASTAEAPVSFTTRTDERPILERRTIDALVKNDAPEIARIRRAYANMFAWSKAHPDDPRSWAQQKLVHSRAATRGETDPAYVIHGSHQFFPWHRAYLYFHERILAWHLTGQQSLDPTFRLPVWGWETDFDSLNDPAIYTDARDPGGKPNPLAYSRRFLLFERNDTNALAAMTFNGRDFLGYPPSSDASSNGSIENGVHANIHVAVGGDMGHIRTAAKDPLFFAHHANIDRLWVWWSRLLGAVAPQTHAAWRGVQWTFADWDGAKIVVRASDLLEHEQRLRYAYGKPTLPFAAPSDAREYAMIRSGSLWRAAQDVRRRVLEARRVALKLLDVRVPGPGHFAIGAIVPGQTEQPQTLGTFIVLDHMHARHANAFLDVSDARTALTHPGGTRLVLMHDPHKHGAHDFSFSYSSKILTTVELDVPAATLHLV